jgi:D-glycero-D-manno-heptose 1,7-bisphosphate phosphatase
VIVVTNQSGVARGLFTLDQVRELHDWVEIQLKAHGAHIDEWCVAHWHPVYSKPVTEKELSYRKPGLGYYSEMIEKYGLNPQLCYCIGDKPSDLQPAVELGMNGFYIKSRFHQKNDQQWLNQHGFVPHENLSEVLLKLKESGVR